MLGLLADVSSYSDYYAFGMTMPGRNYSSDSYRYGFNGKENDNETGWQDYGMRMYNPALGRFFSVDPLTAKYPELTPYQFASNSPIMMIDLDGLEGHRVNPEDITAGAEAGTAYSTKQMGGVVNGSAKASCNFGVRTAFEHITGEKSLYPIGSGGEVGGEGRANDIGTSLANGEISGFEEITDVNFTTMQTEANQGEIIIGLYNSAGSGSGGHIVMIVPGETEYSGTWGKKVPQVLENGVNHRDSKIKLSANVGPNLTLRWYKYNPQLSNDSPTPVSSASSDSNISSDFLIASNKQKYNYAVILGDKVGAQNAQDMIDVYSGRKNAKTPYYGGK